jgi:hypothetical protein
MWFPGGTGYDDLFRGTTAGFGNALKNAIDNQGNVSFLVGFIGDCLVDLATSTPANCTLGSHQGTQAYFDWLPTYQSSAPGGGGCSPTTITPYLQVNGGAWQQTSNVTVASGATVVLGPQPVSGGSWSWSGCGTSGTSREQTITLTSSCTAIATYTNGCGANSTQNFTITVSGGGVTYVTIANRTTGLLIDGMGRTSDGSICGQWSSSGSSNQQWTLETTGSFVKIKNRATGLYLDGMGATTNGSTANQYSSSTSNNQQWVQEITGSFIKFRNNATGLYLDGMGRTTNGSDLGQWSSSSDNNQQWTLTTLKSAIAPGEVASVKKSLDGSIASPNPVTDVLKLQLSAPAKEIAVYSIEGKQLYKLKTTSRNVEIDMSGYKSGVYILKAVGEHESWTQQIIRQ